MIDHRPSTSRPDDPLAQDRRRRRIRTRLVISAVIVTVITLGGAALSGRLPGVPLRDGPLVGVDGVTMGLPLWPTNTGALWGNLTLENRSGSSIVLDSVEVADNVDDLPMLTEPYIWDDSRVQALGVGSVDSYQLPLPADWKLPAKHKIDGYVLKSGTDAQIEQADEKGYEGPTAEVLFEFAVPNRPSTLRGITVRYHVGWLAYSRTFDTTQIFCPSDDRALCAAVGQ
jgi:hypothetical protein